MESLTNLYPVIEKFPETFPIVAKDATPERKLIPAIKMPKAEEIRWIIKTGLKVKNKWQRFRLVKSARKSRS